MSVIKYGVAAAAVAFAVTACQPEKTVQSVGQVFDPSPTGMVEDTEGQFADTFGLKGRDYAAYQTKLPREQKVIMFAEKGWLESNRLQAYVNTVIRKRLKNGLALRISSRGYRFSATWRKRFHLLFRRSRRHARHDPSA